MDPTTNPTPTPNPVPTDGASPMPSAEPIASTTTPVDPMQPVSPTVPPVASPVNPVANPVGAVPTSPIFQPNSINGVAATEPIMQPESAPAPDPVKTELEMPLEAAAPVPGSIGSAVSGPEIDNSAMNSGINPVSPVNSSTIDQFQAGGAGSTNSVSFADPAVQPSNDPKLAGSSAPIKKTSNKTTLIALVIVAFMVVVALGGVLAWQLFIEPNGQQSSPQTLKPQETENIEVDDEDVVEEDEEEIEDEDDIENLDTETDDDADDSMSEDEDIEDTEDDDEPDEVDVE